MDDPDEAAIAEFHAAARRRNVRILGITALICVLIGIAILVVAFTAEAQPGTERYEVRVIVFGIGFVVAGIGSGIAAYKLATEKAT
jgi:uncharacterized membrane protein YczE